MKEKMKKILLILLIAFLIIASSEPPPPNTSLHKMEEYFMSHPGKYTIKQLETKFKINRTTTASIMNQLVIKDSCWILPVKKGYLVKRPMVAYCPPTMPK